ncbi:hypothetical protein E2C01_060565 [Portunus trituberculatus]|uniref:Uncharacterized protein n=1 Tax=Portunus trituberculatus TaxID=210409 RepID=A0A5B7HBS6_PORTR|nr:hypothetical protein [Portunus trituberculatus]
MEALAALHSDMDKLKEERRLGPSCGADDTKASDGVNIRRAGQEVPPSNSPTGFSGFTPAMHCLSSGDSDTQDDVQPDSVLLQCARAYGPVDEVSAGIDKHVADMVNHVFDNGLREEKYIEILDDVATKKADFRMKDVSKDIIKAATILTKSLMVLDKIAQTGQPDVANEVGMLNGALALLGNANHKNNLAHRFIIKHEINQKDAFLCSDKVPMTRLVFGDDVSQSAKHTEESEKLRSKIGTRKPLPTWMFGASKFRGSSGKMP